MIATAVTAGSLLFAAHPASALPLSPDGPINAHQSTTATVKTTASVAQHYSVASGDTLWSISQKFNTTIGQLAFDNHVANANLILVGQVLLVKPGVKTVQNYNVPSVTVHPYYNPVHSQGSTYHPSYTVHSTSVAPSGSFASCVISHESTGNPYVYNSQGSGAWGLYQFMEGTWINYGGSKSNFGNAPPSVQTQIFNNAMAAHGQSNWAGDGC